jgi:uncharacterized protein (DUF362 family)
MNSSRRDFLRCAAAAAAYTLIRPDQVDWLSKSSSEACAANPQGPDLVGVKGGSPAQMFDAGVKALGGMERFVRKGQTVLVKPNIGWNKTPDEGANTHPDLVEKIIRQAYAAGAKKVFVFDHSCDRAEDCYRSSGIAEAVKKSGGTLYPADEEKYYRRVSLEKGKVLRKVLVHQLYLDADVVINVPVLKHHGSTVMTAALKNLMGVVWDRRFWHREGLHECIAEASLLRKVDLTVIDAYTIMTKNGPCGLSAGDLELRKLQILSTDQVLADAAAAKTLDLDPKSVKYLALAEVLGFGTLDLDKRRIERLAL